MKVHYKNNRLEQVLIGANVLAAATVTATFVMQFGLHKPLLPAEFLYTIQAVLLCVFIIEKVIRFCNSASTLEFWQANWFEVPLFVALVVAVLGAGRWFGQDYPQAIRHGAIGVYLVLQVVTKVCRTSINLAASGRNPTQVLIASFLVLIISGAGLLMMPKSSTGQNINAVDALFTATSATCVTGLIVKNTGKDFSFMGQIIILSLIQLGGLGIVVFGAVFALLLGQALSVRESVAMQDLLSAQTVSRIGNMIVFIFVATLCIETVGAVSIFSMWDDVPGRVANAGQQWFYSIFHSISAFCNAGFSLFDDSLISYNKSWALYVVVCPLIILGGLGFSVLYDLFGIAVNRIKHLFKARAQWRYQFFRQAPKRLRLQTKIVLSVSASLIILGTLAILLFERYANSNSASNLGVLDAMFQSVTARTAGFNTVDVSAMSPSSRFVLILLMFVGGSPGSTAGGIKTVTLAVVIMTTVAALRKRQEVEMFRRSVRIVVVGRAITIVMLFAVVLFAATMALSITENSNPNLSQSDIIFETASALGTVGLTTGITGTLTNAGKLIIIFVMLIGRLGPLTLLAELTFNLKPVQYNYPDEAVIVG